MDSILDLVKKNLGIEVECKDFDDEIIMHINSVLMILSQLGVGPKEGFAIQDETSTWSDYIPSGKNLNLVKSYIYIKVRLMFDPPTNSFTVTSMENQAKEYEWRLNVQAESSE